MPSPRILVAAGGAGGHVSAAIAVAEALRIRGARPALVVEGGPAPGPSGAVMAARLAPWCERIVVAESGIPRGPGQWPQRVGVPPRLATATAQLIASMARARPTAVVLLGGAVCAPLAAMARATGARIVVHEQNAVMGVANRVASSLADVVGDAFAARGPLVPVPVRAAFSGRPPPASHRPLRILVVGGSSGSVDLDDAMGRAAPTLAAAGVTGLWTGTRAVAVAGFTAVPFIDDMARAMTDADVIVTAAGAVSLAEAGQVGRACVVLPRRDVAADHQRANTDAWLALGAVVEATPTTLADEVIGLGRDPTRRAHLASALSRWATGSGDGSGDGAGAGWLADQALA